MRNNTLKIGVDVGGTNTDAALLAGPTILASCKVPTTSDVTTGVYEAIATTIKDASVNPADIVAVMVGTTHFLNALVQRNNLSRTGVLRLCGPTSRVLPPMVDWPADLKQCVDGGAVFCDGGVNFDGSQISAVNEAQIREQCIKWLDQGISSVAIASVFSLVDPQDELKAARIVSEQMPNASISLSHEIGQNGLLQRESATILNAALQAVGKATITAFEKAFTDHNLQAQLYLTQNDGTLMSSHYAAQFPVLTIASGPTNSMRGAAFLTGLEDAAVVDIGGTTTDIGVLVSGFPRTKSEGATIAGVLTNFRVPDVLSIGLGGGSVIRNQNELSIGPDSVGSELNTKAKCFGGDTLTATDLIVAMGRAQIGNTLAIPDTDTALLEQAQQQINKSVADIIDRMKPSAEPIPAIFVGGGSILIDGNIDGVSDIVVPEHFGAANAIGAAIAQVSGVTDRIVSLEKTSREAALEANIESAKERATAAGADPTSLEITEIIEIPLAYLPGNAVRLVTKVIGNLKA